MKNTSYNIGAIVILFLTIFISGCVKEEFSVDKLDTTVDLDPAVATPLGYFDLRLNEDLSTTENAELSSNSERIVMIKHHGEIVSDPAADLFQFQDIDEAVSIPNPTRGIIDLSSGAYNYQFEMLIPLFLSNTGGRANLDSIVLSDGMLRITEIGFPDAEGEILIIIPGLKYNGESYRTTINQETSAILEDISNYTLEVIDDDTRNNLVEVRIFLNYPLQSAILFATKPLISFNFDIVLQGWEKVYGYLGKESMDFGRISFSTNLEDNFPGGEFYSYTPSLAFRTRNSFGLPLAMNLDNIIAVTEGSGEIVLKGPGVPTTPEYFYPSYPKDLISLSVAKDSIIIDSDNSNLEEITTSTPLSFSYGVEFITNPDEEIMTNVIFSQSTFATVVELQLPFDGRAKDLTVKDTLAIDFSQVNIPHRELINEIRFKLYYENSFPADIDLQFYLADQDFTITDTLFEDFTRIEAVEPVDEFVENPPHRSGQAEATMPGSRIDNLLSTRYIIGEARLTTNESYERVKIFDNQSLFMSLGVVFDVTTTIDDF